MADSNGDGIPDAQELLAPLDPCGFAQGIRSIPGTGTPIPFTDEAAVTRGPQCFYRLRVWR